MAINEIATLIARAERWLARKDWRVKRSTELANRKDGQPITGPGQQMLHARRAAEDAALVRELLGRPVAEAGPAGS